MMVLMLICHTIFFKSDSALNWGIVTSSSYSSTEQKFGHVQILCVKKVDAFKMWMYRKMLRMSWRDNVTNERMLQYGRKREI